MRLTSILFFLFLPAAVLADSPRVDIDPNAGKILHDRHCIACHARMYGGDGSRMYTREGRLIRSKQDLLQRVGACNAMAKAGWTPEEEAAVAAWLDQQYYQLEK